MVFVWLTLTAVAKGATRYRIIPTVVSTVLVLLYNTILNVAYRGCGDLEC